MLSSALRFPLLLSLSCLGAGVGVDGSPRMEEDMGVLVGETRPENNDRNGVGPKGWSNGEAWGASGEVWAGSPILKEV